jgi:hypothetical protein
MTTTSRQNNLLINQDWTRVYQTFKNADFKSYDFENIRRVMITYLRENYPEDFNDYIESSEYMALIDAMAFMGQSLSFRIDLASRENFIELAETKESVLRLARLISYNAKRNIAASGLLKFDTITTTENILDSNGRNLSQQVIIWNDPTNPSWYEQFILILNSSMSDNVSFGRSKGSDTIDGIQADQYSFRSRFTDVPIFSFEKTVANKRLTFELVSTSFVDSESFYEESPEPNREIGFVYRQDGKGAGSPNTGFFMLLKQGSLELTDFDIATPSTNEVVTVDVPNINNTDVWLYKLDQNGNQIEEWTKVPALTGNNIVYNELSSNVRNIYNIVTKEDDKIDLVFADGVYGNLPKGSFRTYYRTSSGLEYSITPTDMRGINIAIPYTNKEGVEHELTISLSLKYTISNSAASEDIDSIRVRAPAIYYSQNRMVTGEDYNLAPLSSSQDIIKVKAINRTSSGISRNFDILDATGKYSSVNVFADDGFLYKEETEKVLSFKYTNRIDVINFIRTQIEPVLASNDLFNFYLTKYEKILFTNDTTTWTQVTDDITSSTGYFVDIFGTLLKTGTYTNNTLKYLLNESLIKFVPPSGKAFRLGKLVDIDLTDPLQTDKIWTKIVRITGDGTNAGRGVLATGYGPIVFSEVVPTGAIANRILPRFSTSFSQSLINQMVNIVTADLNFGIRFDNLESLWKIITSANINTSNQFNLGSAGDTSNSNIDSSWMINFIKEPDQYVVTIRNIDYVFGSLMQNRFYFDQSQKIYDSKSGSIVKDNVKILGINTSSDLISVLGKDLSFEISSSIDYDDGFSSSKEVKLAFSDSDDDGVIDNPDSFEDIVGLDSNLRYIFFERLVDASGNPYYEYVDNPDYSVIQLEYSVDSVDINSYNNGDKIYFYSPDENRVMLVNRTTNTFSIQPQYKSVIGRSGLKFQYLHNSSVDRRIDPSVSNIIDVYLLTRNYDREIRNYLKGASTTLPTAPSSDNLRISYGEPLSLIKTVSDEIIYHSANYKILFGESADLAYRATFKIVKNVNRSVNDNDLKVRVVNAINEFFDVNNWDFGDRFYLGELITYITNEVTPDISNIILVPKQPDLELTSLFEIQSRQDEIFISGATVDDIEIVSSISSSDELLAYTTR